MEIVISLLMFLGTEQLVLKEHLYIQDQKMGTCLKMKRLSERSTSNAKFSCSRVKATVIIDEYSGKKKITSIASLDD